MTCIELETTDSRACTPALCSFRGRPTSQTKQNRWHIAQQLVDHDITAVHLKLVGHSDAEQAEQALQLLLLLLLLGVA